MTASRLKLLRRSLLKAYRAEGDFSRRFDANSGVYSDPFHCSSTQRQRIETLENSH